MVPLSLLALTTLVSGVSAALGDLLQHSGALLPAEGPLEARQGRLLLFFWSEGGGNFRCNNGNPA